MNSKTKMLETKAILIASKRNCLINSSSIFSLDKKYSMKPNKEANSVMFTHDGFFQFSQSQGTPKNPSTKPIVQGLIKLKKIKINLYV